MSNPVGTPGRIFKGRWALQTPLGRGAMGEVWRTWDLTLNAPAAVKLLDPAVADNESGRLRFTREAHAAAALRSPHVVQVLDYGVEDDGTPFIAMEMLEGESLGKRLAREGQLSPARAATILAEVGRALTRAHQAQIVHRDLKPDNIYLVKNEDVEMAKLLDFGIVKTHDSGPKTKTGTVLGTPYYLSPEQVRGEAVDHRADIWAVAVIAFECMTGQRPFVDEDIVDLALSICVRPMPVPSQVAGVPAGFDDWFARAASRDLNGRYQSVREATDDLSRACASAQLLAARVATQSLPRLATVSVTHSSAAFSVTPPPPTAPPSSLSVAAASQSTHHSLPRFGSWVVGMGGILVTTALVAAAAALAIYAALGGRSGSAAASGPQEIERPASVVSSSPAATPSEPITHEPSATPQQPSATTSTPVPTQHLHVVDVTPPTRRPAPPQRSSQPSTRNEFDPTKLR